MVRKCVCLIAAVLLLHTQSFAAAGSAFENRCTDLGKEAKIAVFFVDRQVTRNDSLNLSELKGVSGSRSNQYHSILGLTHAVPSAKLDVTPNMLTDENGRTCVVPSLALTLGFSEFDVYLAKELTDSCRRRIVEEHENQHVGVWRNHFRAGGRLLETTLRNTLVKPTYSSSQDEAVKEMRHNIDEVISSLLQKLKDGAVAANQQLDSPASYQFEENRMRGCP